MKRRTKAADQRAKKALLKAQSMDKPRGKSRYGRKNRDRERARGYSNRPTSPFFMLPAAVRAARSVAP